MIENAFHSGFSIQRRSGRVALSLAVAASVGLLLPAAFYLVLGREPAAPHRDDATAASGTSTSQGSAIEGGTQASHAPGQSGTQAVKTDAAAGSTLPAASAPAVSSAPPGPTEPTPSLPSPAAAPAAPQSPSKSPTDTPPKADPAKIAAVAEAIQAARAAMRDRDLAKAQERLTWAAANAASPEQAAEVERLHTLWDYLDGFWEAVRKAIRGLKGSEEIEVGQTMVIVVEVRGETLTVRTAGQNLSYTPPKMPSGLAFALAEGWFSKAEPSSKMFLGAFLAVDPKGDRQRARRLWEEAKRSGVAVDLLMPELAGATAEGSPGDRAKELEAKVAAVETAAKQARTAAASREAAQNGLALLDEAISADRADLADRLAKTALAAARKASDVRLSKLAVQRSKEVQTLLKNRPEPKKPAR